LAIVLVASIALTGCGSDQPTLPGLPSLSPSAGRPTPSRTSTSAAPSPSPDPGHLAMMKFVALVTRSTFAYQATFTGDSRYTVSVLTIRKGLLQVNGDAVRVRATFFDTRTRVRAVVEHRDVGGRAWIRFATLPWHRLTSFAARDSMAAFAGVHTPADVTFVGPTKVGGKTFYKIKMASAIVNPIMNPFSNQTETAVTASKLELRIDAAGRPISGIATITGRGRISGQLQENVIDLKVSFIKVGQKVTISAP
jgi:hypothetical protein